VDFHYHGKARTAQEFTPPCTHILAGAGDLEGTEETPQTEVCATKNEGAPALKPARLFGLTAELRLKG
jgi:hypothetical protein